MFASEYVSSFSLIWGREPFHGLNVPARVANRAQRSWTTREIVDETRIVEPHAQRASAATQVIRDHNAGEALGGVPRAVSAMSRNSAGKARSIAAGAQLILALVLIPRITVGRKLRHRLPLVCTCVANGFPGSDSSPADQRNWFCGNSLLSSVVRSVGGERQK
jgi:hypothetical protein